MTTTKKSKRGRPRGFDLDQALLTALELFHRKGYDGVGVAELSKAIGITAPSLYAAFGSKRELFEQVLKRYIELEGSWLPAALSVEGGIETVMTDFFVRAAEVYTTNPDQCGCLVMDATRNCADEQAKALTHELKSMTRQMICDRIATGAPTLSKSEVETLSNFAIMILVGLSGSARDGMNPTALRETADTAAQGFVQKLHSYQ